MQRDRTASAERLLHDVGWAMQQGLGPRDLIPMLKKLIAHAAPGSDPALFGMRELAKLLVVREPWTAARLARSVLEHGDDFEAWGALGIALTALGHYRAAAHAHRQALALEPGCPVTAHNLGHVLDVGLSEPERALHYLELSHRIEPEDVEIAASYAHALCRVGRSGQALALLSSRLEGGESEARALIARWLIPAG